MGSYNASTMTDILKEVLERDISMLSKVIQTEPLLNRPMRQGFQEFKNGIDKDT